MNQHRQAFLTWLLGSTVLVFVFSLGFAHAPAPFKRLGLSYAGFGLVCGVCLCWLAGERKVQFSFKLAGLAGLLVIAGGLNIGRQSYQLFKTSQEEILQRDPEQLAMLNMLEQISDDADSADYQERRRLLQPNFVDYLTFRVSQLGGWKAPWSVLFWLGEVLVAGLIATGLTFQLKTQKLAMAQEAETPAVEEN